MTPTRASISRPVRRKADMLVQDVLSRNMRDRRAVAHYAGLIGSPDESGAKCRQTRYPDPKSSTHHETGSAFVCGRALGAEVV
jgi:hypothetical protein